MFALVLKGNTTPPGFLDLVGFSAILKRDYAREPSGSSAGGQFSSIRHGGASLGWITEDGSPLDAPTAAALKAIVIPLPPAWQRVRINLMPGAALQATGVDAKGRVQYRYSAASAAEGSAAKFARVSELNAKMPKLMQRSQSDMADASLSHRERATAAMVYLVTRTGFRPGSTTDTKADEQAYGASTLEKRHIGITGETVAFNFTGKSAVTITKKLRSKAMSTYLQGSMSSLKPEDTVFKSSAGSAMAYLKKHAGDQFKLKDLRTWNGTAVAREALSKESVPDTAKALKAQQLRISQIVAAHLGNTPTVALKHYIDPSVWRSTEGMAPIKRNTT